jgi:pimeloyl-ACP methyl ester carboxylesterase
MVGHSLGGLTIPLVAARRPVRHLVYLCALVPDIGRSWMDQIADEPEMMCPGWNAGLSEPDSQHRTMWIARHHTRKLLYDDCDEATVESAIARIRPQVGLGSTPFTLTEFPPASATSVICTEDRMVARDWARRTARDRLGAEIITLPGSHSPFFSRPDAGVDVLSDVAHKV